MLLVERHIINKNHIYFKEIDNLCFKAKNLYHYANYLIRQSFIFDKKYLNYNVIQKLCQDTFDYKALPAKVSQQVLIRLNEAWQGFFSSIQSYRENQKFFFSPLGIPKYLHKSFGSFPCTYTVQAIRIKYLKKLIVNPSKTSLLVKTKVNHISQVRLFPKSDYIDYLAANQIETLVIGHNDKWKQSINLGKRNNQNFVSIPFN
ncbi:MAG: hypothetical protein AAFV71_32650 [Cyanobacteria bacterium J06633_8]